MIKTAGKVIRGKNLGIHRAALAEEMLFGVEKRAHLRVARAVKKGDDSGSCWHGLSPAIPPRTAIRSSAQSVRRGRRGDAEFAQPLATERCADLEQRTAYWYQSLSLATDDRMRFSILLNVVARRASMIAKALMPWPGVTVWRDLTIVFRISFSASSKPPRIASAITGSSWLMRPNTWAITVLTASISAAGVRSLSTLNRCVRITPPRPPMR
jgi:hypothetical protein